MRGIRWRRELRHDHDVVAAVAGLPDRQATAALADDRVVIAVVTCSPFVGLNTKALIGIRGVRASSDPLRFLV
jgi:hypothetical protein